MYTAAYQESFFCPFLSIEILRLIAIKKINCLTALNISKYLSRNVSLSVLYQQCRLFTLLLYSFIILYSYVWWLQLLNLQFVFFSHDISIISVTVSELSCPEAQVTGATAAPTAGSMPPALHTITTSCIPLLVVETETPFRRLKFPPQIKHFCCGSAFLLHDNGVLHP